MDLRGGRHLQVVAYDATQAHTSNVPCGDALAEIDRLLAMPFGNWHVDSVDATAQLRVTKRGGAVWSASASESLRPIDTAHDRARQRVIAPDDPVLAALGVSDGAGRVKPSRMAKYKQVEAFVRELAAAVDEAMGSGRLRTPAATRPWHVVDLGCGNAYLTFAALAWFRSRGLPVHLTGVDVKEQSRAHNAAVAARLGATGETTFVVGGIADVVLEPAPDIVLALHACDTATDDALARGIGWKAPLILAAPCCHHDIARQLRRATAPEPYGALVRDGILRERFADTLTDALRAELLRQRGYRVDVNEFVDSAHTPRNSLLRCVRVGDGEGDGDGGSDRGEGDGGPMPALAAAWDVTPRLVELLDRRAQRGGYS